MDTEFIKSPLNYTGNKYRILSQMAKHFPAKTGVFVDMFCGGATVGFNVNADKIILIDRDPKVIGLLEFLAAEKIDNIIQGVEKLVAKYGLSYSARDTYAYYKSIGGVDGNNGLRKHNFEGYYKLRSDYNALKNKSTPRSYLMLYTLMVYAFNNDMRFNSKGEFNLPVGKTDLNKNNLKKLRDYNERAKKIDYEFVCEDFRSEKVEQIVLGADFIYVDPPYLITNAVYNENHGWNEDCEHSLMKLLTLLAKNNKQFAVSNVMQKTGMENSILKAWAETNKLVINKINYHYRSASYNKKNRQSNEEEVLITNAATAT